MLPPRTVEKLMTVYVKYCNLMTRMDPNRWLAVHGDSLSRHITREISLCRDDAEDPTKYERVAPTGPTFMENDKCLRMYVDGAPLF
jgi:hypothetical protein